MIAPFFIAGFDTPSDLCCRIRLYNKGLCPLIPEFIALGFRRSKKEQHQVLLLQTSNNNYGWNKYHAGIFGEVNSTPYPCKSKFQSEVWDNWNLIFQLTYFLYLFQSKIHRQHQPFCFYNLHGKSPAGYAIINTRNKFIGNVHDIYTQREFYRMEQLWEGFHADLRRSLEPELL